MSDQQKPQQHPSNNVTAENVDDVFEYQPPDALQRGKYIVIRAAAKLLAKEILNACPPCADRTAAIRKLREVVMTANAAIALEPRLVVPDEP